MVAIEEECLCGERFCEEEHPSEAEFVKLAKKEAPEIIRRLKKGLKPGLSDLAVLRMAGRKVPKWKHRKR